jgi:peptidyl-prolyl cis-trans isomerase A (cyclophilin A)
MLASNRTGLLAQSQSAPEKKEAPAPAFNRALLNPAQLVAKAPDSYDVKFSTTKGDFVVRVTRAWAPLGADRFYNLVKNDFFTDVSFFRVVPGFVVQFGLSPHPEVSLAWYRAVIKDDPVKQQNKRGRITFATSGANSRTTQVFINLSDSNVQLDGMGFSPFGEVVEGINVVERLYSGYGESTTNRQGEIMQNGGAFLEKNFPRLDKIKTATIVSPAAAPVPAKSPEGK